jgi:hypothetical protein
MVFRVKYIGRDVPTAEADGWVARLRLVRDGEYVQFFRAYAPAHELLTLETKPNNDWWTEFILAAAREIERLVEAGLKPTAPGTAMLLLPDVHEAHRAARTPNPGRRHVTATEPPLEGIDVHRFGEENDIEDRRRTSR